MVNLIKKFFDSGTNGKEDLNKDVKLAACVVLLEVAYSDEEFTRDERGFIVDALKKQYDLSGGEADELIRTGEKILEDDTNRWRYMNTINENFSNEEKIRFFESIWELIYTDDRLDKYEQHIVHKLSKVFHVPHHELINAKLKVLDSKK
jgi:uncharacterized tellurite resistance protein B-like protein